VNEERTLPSRVFGLPVRAIHVEVVRGPDRGKRLVGQLAVVAVGTAAGNDLVLTDPTVSRYHLQLERRADRILVRDTGSTNGTLVGPALLEDSSAAIAGETVLSLGETSLRVDDGGVVMVDVRKEGLGELRGRTEPMQRLMGLVERLAAKDTPVLVMGESGTGKELVARALHETGHRRHAPFVTVDCTLLTPALFASELFGHERGAFTGAERRHEGAFERAHGGTLFLDEVGELPPPLQAALLGVLERRVIRRVGGRDDIAVDVRVISATLRDLRAAVNAGAFRLDLFYRLAVVMVPVPPLRERSADLPMLVEHFLRQGGYDGVPEALFPPARMQELRAHHWPGNVRELRNVVDAVLATGQPPLLDGRDALPAAPDVIGAVLGQPYREARAALTSEFERRYLADLLTRTGGNVRAAAREARMDRTYLIELLRRHGLP
jgi:DNA-binding NtrC family response regulator